MNNFIDYLKSHIGDIYVWGAQGETGFNFEWIKKKETSIENVNRVIKLYNRRVAEGKKNICAFDCSGLIVRFFLDNNLITNDMTAQGLCGLCAKIGKDELRAGDLVFRDNGTRVNHVGVYIGGGRVIHARGRDYGVVEEDINKNGANWWNRFGRFFKEENNMKVLKLTTPLMHGDDVKMLQLALNALGYPCGEPDGVCGKQTMAAIDAFGKAHSAVHSVSATVNVNGDSFVGELKRG